MNNPVRRIETIANISIIILAVLVGAVFVKRYFFAAPTEPDFEIHAGTKVSLPDVDWIKNGQTLLIVLQRECRFCSESAPFYQRLVRETESLPVRLLAVFPHDVDTGKKYLADMKILIKDVRQADLRSLGIRGTPTLILVNDKGEVIDSWSGKLPADKETEVLKRLQAKREK